MVGSFAFLLVVVVTGRTQRSSRTNGLVSPTTALALHLAAVRLRCNECTVIVSGTRRFGFDRADRFVSSSPIMIALPRIRSYVTALCPLKRGRTIEAQPIHQHGRQR